MNKPWLMGLDLGGSGVRCLLLNRDTGATVCTRAAWRFTPAPGTFGTGFDLDLGTLWEAVGIAARDALSCGQITGDAVAGVAVSAMRFSTVVVDGDGRCLLSVPNTDARAAGECFEIAAQHAQQTLTATGCWPLPLHASARLLWLRGQDAARFDSARTVYGFGEWLTERLCGARAIDASQASTSGLFSLAGGDWHWPLIDALALPRALFPPIVPAGTAVGTLGADAALHLGLPAGTPVGMGGADTQLSLLGAGVTEPGQCAIVAGTTAPVQAVVAAPTHDPAGALLGACHVIPGRWVLESNGGPMGFTLSLLARTLFPAGPQPELRLLATAAQSEPGAAGLLSTLGAEVMNMAAPSLPVGQISLSHMHLADEPAPARHVARALVEGCACAVRANLERIEQLLGTRLDDLALCAGLSRSALFNQLVASITDRAISVPAVHDTSALGAALCAAVAAGVHTDLGSAARAVTAARRQTAPDSAQTATYQQLYATWSRYRAQAQAATDPVAIDHLLPHVLKEAPAAPTAPAPAQRPAALVTAAFDAASLDRLRAVMDVEYASFREVKRLLTGPDLVRALAGKQVLVTEVDILDADALRQLPDLRVVAACRGDAVNVDVEACTAFGVPVLYAPGRNAIAVADLTVGFMLSLARKLPAAGQFLRHEDCTAGNMGKMGQAFNQLQGVELWRKTIGLVGLGAVGRAVAARLAGFEARLLVADPFATPDQAALAGCELVDLDLLLSTADFVSLHAAVTPATTGLIGTAEFARMKKGAFFINTARAALVDEPALIAALESGHLAGAALDTFAVEPPGFDHPLVRHPHVLSTPHSAGNTVEVANHQGEAVSAALAALLAGGRPRNVLNPQVLDDFRWSGARREPSAAELEQLRNKRGPAVTDLQRDAKPAASAAPVAAATAPADIVANMTAILERFCAGLVADETVRAFSADQDVTLHFTAHDLGLQFYLGLDHGTVHSAVGAPPGGAEVQLQMRGEILDGMFNGTIDTMECAMNGEISFMGDAAKAMTLQHLNDDMARLYRAARTEVGDPGDLASIPRPGSAAAAPAKVGPGDVREELVAIMQELYESQVITATGGNISVRIPGSDNEVWITPSRLFKGDLKPEVMVRINLEGKSLDAGSRSPSSEWCMHTRVLEQKPQATAVIHAHAPNATILANAGLPFLPISTEAAFFGNIPRVPFLMPGTPELADAVAEQMADEWAVLMINHGILVAGRNLRRAADMVEIIERTAEVILGCYAVGKEPPLLPPDAVAHFRKLGDIVA